MAGSGITLLWLGFRSRLLPRGRSITAKMTVTITATADAPIAIVRLRFTALIGTVPTAVVPPLGVDSASNCGNNSSAVGHLSAAFFSKHFITSAANAGGTDSRYFVTGSGVCVT